jgi:hypothetical protein
MVASILRKRGSVLCRGRFPFSAQHPGRLGSTKPPIQWIPRTFFSGDKAAGMCSWYQVNPWSCISTPPFVFLAGIFVKYRNSFVSSAFLALLKHAVRVAYIYQSMRWKRQWPCLRFLNSLLFSFAVKSVFCFHESSCSNRG